MRSSELRRYKHEICIVVHLAPVDDDDDDAEESIESWYDDVWGNASLCQLFYPS